MKNSTVSAFLPLGPWLQTFSAPMENFIHISSSYFGRAVPGVTSNALADVCAELHSHGARNPDVTKYPERVEGISRLECEVCRGVALETQVDVCWKTEDVNS